MKTFGIHMRRSAAILLSLLTFGTLATTPAIAKANIEDFGRLPSVSHMEVSRDGTMMAFVTDDGKSRELQVRKISDESIVRFAPLGDKKVLGIGWADADHIVVLFANTTYGEGIEGALIQWGLAVSIDIKKGTTQPLLSGSSSSAEMTMNVVFGWPQVRAIEGKTRLFVTGMSFPGTGHRSVVTLFRQDASSPVFFQYVTGGEATDNILVDKAGNPVARTDFDQNTGLWSLFTMNGGAWRLRNKTVAPIEHPFLAGFGRNRDALIVGFEENGSTRYRELPIAEGEMSPPIAKLDDATLVEDPLTRTVIGGSWSRTTDVRYAFLDPFDQAAWDGIVKAFPGEAVRLSSWSDDRSIILLRVEGKEHGAAFFLVDRRNHRAGYIADEYRNIAPEDVNAVQAVDYRAADGRELMGYLTLPSGTEAKNLPLVVLVHGGPAARDYPGFDWWSQALAAQGYAVFQPQYRGSVGPGDLLQAGYGEFGRKMQTDVSDGVKHLAALGLIDPNRVCITGASYGGYAALAGVTLQSGIYRCAVSVAGPSDMKRMLSDTIDVTASSKNQGTAFRYWKRFFGANSASDPILDAISPARHADKLSVPLLLIHGNIDTVVAPEQSRIMQAAAQRAGKSVEYVVLNNEDHNLSKSATRLQMLTAMIDFLKRNLSPDGAARGNPAAMH